MCSADNQPRTSRNTLVRTCCGVHCGGILYTCADSQREGHTAQIWAPTRVLIYVCISD